MSRRAVRNGPLHLRSFPDELRDLMDEEKARSRKSGGSLHTYRDVVVAALVRYFSSHYERRDAELQHALRKVRPT